MRSNSCVPHRKSQSHFFLKEYWSYFLAWGMGLMCKTILWAGEKEDEDTEAMQKVLNRQVLDKPFYFGDKAAVNAYLEEAINKKV
jgi:hypothetical protein